MKMDFSFSIFFFRFLAEVSSGRGAGKEFDCREGEMEMGERNSLI